MARLLARAGSAPVRLIVPVTLKLMVSSPGMLLAARIASRRLVNASGMIVSARVLTVMTAGAVRSSRGSRPGRDFRPRGEVLTALPRRSRDHQVRRAIVDLLRSHRAGTGSRVLARRSASKAPGRPPAAYAKDVSENA